ncbi:MAG: COP23 domain-containing protein [Nostocaceae cyanobacterium]|nr:COP23 domain-containing protein [Nostocaceae cyanobacterium]
MFSSTLKLLVFGTVGLSLFWGNSVAFAQTQTRSTRDVVVPTTTSTGDVNTSQTTTSTTTTGTGTSTTTTNSSSSSTTTIDTVARFGCQMYNGQYTVMYQPENQPNQYFPWATPRTLGGGWNAQKRCLTIAQRLESYRPDGLVELRTSTANGYDILCVTTEIDKDKCKIVLTVPPEKDPYQVRNSVFQNLITADSGQQTIGVNTYTNRNGGSEIDQFYNLGRTLLGGRKNRPAVTKDAINLKHFLSRKDGGYGTYLNNGVTINRPTQSQSGLRLPKSLR